MLTVQTGLVLRCWRHPEWWAVALSVVGWLVLLAASGPLGGEHHHRRFAIDVAMWLVMVVAMMFPLVIGAIRLTAFRSLWRRRHRAIAVFLAGYVSPWLLFGLIVLLLQRSLLSEFRGAVLAGIGFLIAAAWQWAPMRVRALRACHRTRPLAPSGWKADLDCIKFGCSVGVPCVASCWALMLACAFAGHSALPMMAATAVALIDRGALRVDPRLTPAGLVVMALIYGLARS